MLFASDFWKTKDSSQWTDEEISKILSESPWAKAKTVQPQQSQTQRRGGGGRRGGFGFPGGGLGGGYPGGGGGGYPQGGGGGYPQGGGGGYPGGSGGGNNGDPSQSEPMNLTIRWASAAPIQQALMRQGASASDELKAVAASTEKYYVITVLGLRMARPHSSTVDADNPDDNGNNNGDDNGQRRSRNRGDDALRSQLLDAAQLAPKGKSSIYAQDVQIVGPGGIDGVRFLFPRTIPISGGDKEVDFILDIRRIKVDEKFKVSDMQYEGKLAL
jgi:hypothetical protein